MSDQPTPHNETPQASPNCLQVHRRVPTWPVVIDTECGYEYGPEDGPSYYDKCPGCGREIEEVL